MSVVDTNTYDTPPLTGFYSYTDTLKGVYYGPGCVKTAIPKLLKTLGVKKALIVTGKSLHQKVCCEIVTQSNHLSVIFHFLYDCTHIPFAFHYGCESL